MQKRPDVKYKIIGDGPIKSELEELIKDLKISNSVKQLGWKKQEEVVKLMEEADIFLAPSVTSYNGDQEGIPVVLMEALAQGLPVISTYHSGIPELVKDGVSGYLVHERDVNALSERLGHFIENQNLWAKMGRAGRNYIENYYNIDKLKEQLVEIFQKLVNRNESKYDGSTSKHWRY